MQSYYFLYIHIEDVAILGDGRSMGSHHLLPEIVGGSDVTESHPRSTRGCSRRHAVRWSMTACDVAVGTSDRRDAGVGVHPCVQHGTATLAEPLDQPADHAVAHGDVLVMIVVLVVVIVVKLYVEADNHPFSGLCGRHQGLEDGRPPERRHHPRTSPKALERREGSAPSVVSR